MGNELLMMARRTFSLATAAWLALGSLFLVTALVEDEALAPIFTGLLPWAPAAPQESVEKSVNGPELIFFGDAPAPISVFTPPPAPAPISVEPPPPATSVAPVSGSASAASAGSTSAPSAQVDAAPPGPDEPAPPTPPILAPILAPVADVIDPEPDDPTKDDPVEPADTIEVAVELDAEVGPVDAHAEATVTATDPVSAVPDLS